MKFPLDTSSKKPNLQPVEPIKVDTKTKLLPSLNKAVSIVQIREKWVDLHLIEFGEILSYGINKRPSARNVMNALNEAIELIYKVIQQAKN